MLEYVHEARHLFQREEQPSVGIRAWGKAFVSKRRTVECWNTCRGKGICFIEKNSRVLEFVHGKGICFKEKNSRVLEHVHGARHLFQREEKPSFGICAWDKAFVTKRRTAKCWNRYLGQGIFSKRKSAECWNTCMGQGICFKDKNSQVLET